MYTDTLQYAEINCSEHTQRTGLCPSDRSGPVPCAVVRRKSDKVSKEHVEFIFRLKNNSKKNPTLLVTCCGASSLLEDVRETTFRNIGKLSEDYTEL
jgi:hypothetical protein